MTAGSKLLLLVAPDADVSEAMRLVRGVLGGSVGVFALRSFRPSMVEHLSRVAMLSGVRPVFVLGEKSLRACRDGYCAARDAVLVPIIG